MKRFWWIGLLLCLLVVVWAGAGLSKPANLPSWPKLLDGLCESLEEKAAKVEEEYEQKRLYADLTAVGTYRNNWLAFQRLRVALGPTTYRSTIRTLFCDASRCLVPNNYKLLWKLPLDGILNLNLDRLASRAHSEIVQGKTILNEFSGPNIFSFSPNKASKINLLGLYFPSVTIATGQAPEHVAH